MVLESLRDKIFAVLKFNLDDVTDGSRMGIMPRNIRVYYAPDVPEKIYNCAKKYFDCWESKEDILAVVDTTLSGICDEGLIFSDTAMHYKNGYSKPEHFSYSMIKNISVIPHRYGDALEDALEIDMWYGNKSIISSSLYRKSVLKSMLEQILAACDKDSERIDAKAEALFYKIFNWDNIANANSMLEELEKISKNMGKLQSEFEKARNKLKAQNEQLRNNLKKARDALGIKN